MTLKHRARNAWHPGFEVGTWGSWLNKKLEKLNQPKKNRRKKFGRKPVMVN